MLRYYSPQPDDLLLWLRPTLAACTTFGDLTVQLWSRFALERQDRVAKFNLALGVYKLVEKAQSDNELATAWHLVNSIFSNLDENPFVWMFLTHLLSQEGNSAVVLGAILAGMDYSQLPINATLPPMEYANGFGPAVEALLKVQAFDDSQVGQRVVRVVKDLAGQGIASTPQIHANLVRMLNILEMCPRTDIFEQEIPPGWVLFTVYDYGLDRRVLRGAVLSQIKRARASMAMVDYFHRSVIMGKFTDQEFRECLYEFVDYNLSHTADQETCVGLLAKLISSLYQKGHLEPMSYFTTLFGSFLPWIATVDEARVVYKLKDQDG